jgi:hypothetical protein
MITLRSAEAALVLSLIFFTGSLWLPEPWDIAAVVLSSLAAGAALLFFFVSRARHQRQLMDSLETGGR